VIDTVADGGLADSDGGVANSAIVMGFLMGGCLVDNIAGLVDGRWERQETVRRRNRLAATWASQLTEVVSRAGLLDRVLRGLDRLRTSSRVVVVLGQRVAIAVVVLLNGAVKILIQIADIAK
jgi:hypothetical protein